MWTGGHIIKYNNMTLINIMILLCTTYIYSIWYYVHSKTSLIRHPLRPTTSVIRHFLVLPLSRVYTRSAICELDFTIYALYYYGLETKVTEKYMKKTYIITITFINNYKLNIHHTYIFALIIRYLFFRPNPQ